MNTTHIERIIRPLVADLETLTRPDHASLRQVSRPFITISRQAGAGGTTLARKLVERLNREANNEHQWKLWDRELVETVAAENHLSKGLVDAMEEQSRSWLDEFFGGLQFNASATDLRTYHRVGATIRALATAGYGVIVGRGGSFITQNLPGGIHVRLVAPLDWRIKHAAETFGFSEKSAAEWVKKTDHGREIFHNRFGPSAGLTSEAFDITLNSSRTDFDHLVECIVPLLHRRNVQPPNTSASGYAKT